MSYGSICDEPNDHLVSLRHFLHMGLQYLCRPQSSLLNFNINERSTINRDAHIPDHIQGGLG